jgi:type II secretory ATPase GspE/PulE/Tfp pilus assembly ATPase PilB-like protein
MAMSTPDAGSEGLAAFLLKQLVDVGINEHLVRSAADYHVSVEGSQPLSRTLVDLGLAGDEQVARWIASHTGLRFVPREQLQIENGAHRLLAESISRRRHALVLSASGDRAVVAIADPSAPQFSQVIHALGGREVEWVVSTQADISLAAAEAFSAGRNPRGNEMEGFVEDMLRLAATTRGVSDIHCIPTEKACEIRWRVDGELVPWRTLPGSIREALCAQLKLASTRGRDGFSPGEGASGGLDVANHHEPQDAAAIRDYGSRRVSLRFSVIPAISGESIAIRILDQGAQVGTLEDLGMAADMALVLRRELRRPNGIILVCGPTGHGKSTTLAACVPSLDTTAKRVLSVEDPVEYRLRGVTQFPVGPRMGFAGALRSFLRHNPDVVIVGEIRDADTAAIAARLALTGHLIISTVHANSAVQALTRLIDLGVDPAILSSTVRVLLSQRLARRVCTACARPHTGARVIEERCGCWDGDAAPARYLEAGGGCQECSQSGFKGRIGLFEMRLPRREVTELLTGHARFDAGTAEVLYARAYAKGDLLCRTLRRDGLAKARMGLTTPEEVDGAASEDFKSELNPKKYEYEN